MRIEFELASHSQQNCLRASTLKDNSREGEHIDEDLTEQSLGQTQRLRRFKVGDRSVLFRRENMLRRTRGSKVLLRRDVTTGNWTVSPSPEPSPPHPHPKPSQHGPPYGTSMAVVGGVPTLATDIPVAAVLLGLFVASAAAHITILHANKRNGVKFLFSGMMFALCVLRSAALSMRIAWATSPHEPNVAIAAGILTQTGSVIVFIINLLLAQRVVRGYHPRFGWHPAATFAFLFLVGCAVASLVMVIAVTVQSLFTLDAGIRRSDRIVQLFGGTYMALLAFLPLPIIVVAALVPRADNRPIEKFGTGRWRTKMWLLGFTSALATAAAAFRVYTGYVPRPVNDPAWYHSRACYYCFNFVTDLIISTAYLFFRFDRRFVVPNGAKGPGDYGKGARPRRPSVMSSDGGEEKADDTDPEKFAKLRGDSNENGHQKAAPPPIYDHNGKDESQGKGKGRDIDMESDDKRANSLPSPTTAVDRSTQTYDPGADWYSWPFRTSWAAMPNNCRPAPSSANQPSADVEPPLINEPPADGPPADKDVAGIEELSSQWGGETSTATYVQELDRGRSRPTQRQFHPHQLPQSRPHTMGQAYTADEALQTDPANSAEHATVWPSWSETHLSGHDPNNGVPSRSHSMATYSPTSSSRAPSRGRINRSLSCKVAEIYNPAGGWI